jgi:hypothetical protein
MLRLVMSVLWPSFLVAILAEGFFFSLFDPNEVSLFGTPVEVSPIAAYTVGFFFFWLFCALASMLTYYLISVPREQRPPF